MKKIESVLVDAIEIGKRLRRVDAFAVNALAESMKQLGQLQPISVYAPDNAAAHLVAGLHRLEAAKQLGWEEIDAIFVTGDEIDRALQEIAENLHRSELTALERSEQIAKWVELIERRRQAVQVEHPDRYERRGQALASKELGLSRPDVHRALKVSSLSPEAKQAARDAGLDNNRSALLIASKEVAKDQAPKILQIAHTKRGLASILSIQETIKRGFDKFTAEQDTRKKKKGRKPRFVAPKSTPEQRDEFDLQCLKATWGDASDNARAAFLKSVRSPLRASPAAICATVKEAILSLYGQPPAHEVVGWFAGTDAAFIISEHLRPTAAWLADFAAAWPEELADATPPAMVGAD